MKKFIKDYANFWGKNSHNEMGERVCKKPFTHWMITCLVIAIMTLTLSSCGTSQYNVGTGNYMHKQCQGAWTGGQ